MASLMPEPYPTSFKKATPFSSKHVVAPPETEIIFNLSCEPGYKYSLPAFADYSCDPTQRTSNILHANALYLETLDKRFEISKEGGLPGKGETYRIAEVLEPFTKNSDFMMQSTIPLAPEHTKVLLLSLIHI